MMLSGIAVYFFGRSILRKLVVPFLLLLLAIPIPQIIFNKIAFPLQIWASQVADWGIRAVGIATIRMGNVIELTPLGSTRAVGLEIVEACSGIRSLMTLVTLALILGYFTRERREDLGRTWSDLTRDPDAARIVLLMIAAVPIALITNAARVMTTGILTFRFGPDAASGLWHELSGSFVFLTALALLILVNLGLKRIVNRFGDSNIHEIRTSDSRTRVSLISNRQTLVLFSLMLIGGVFINWFQHRGELRVERRPLSEIPAQPWYMGTARPGYSLRSRIGKGFEGQRLCDARIPWPRPTSESIRRLLRITAFGCDLSQPAELPARRRVGTAGSGTSADRHAGRQELHGRSIHR